MFGSKYGEVFGPLALFGLLAVILVGVVVVACYEDIPIGTVQECSFLQCQVMTEEGIVVATDFFSSETGGTIKIFSIEENFIIFP